MLFLNLLNLIKNKIIPLKYGIKKQEHKSIYIDTNINYDLIAFFDVLNYSSFIYLYIYKYISLRQKILIFTNYIHYTTILKSIMVLTNNYYIYNKSNFEFFENEIMLKKKLTLYNWLEYFFFIDSNFKAEYKNKFLINHILYILYLKLKIKYTGIKCMNTLPNTLIFLLINNNKYLKKIYKINKHIFIITNKVQNSSSENVFQLIIKNTNFISILFLLKIITTSIFHGILNYI